MFNNYNQKSCWAGGTPRTGGHVEWNNSQSGGKLAEDGSTTNTVMETMIKKKYEVRWTS